MMHNVVLWDVLHDINDHVQSHGDCIAVSSDIPLLGSDL